MSNLFLILFLSCMGNNNMDLKNESTSSIFNKIKKGEDVSVQHETFSDELNFVKLLKATKLNNNLAQHECSSTLVFKNCTFKKNVVAYSMAGQAVEYTSFKKSVVFENCTFEGEVNFRQADFRDRVDFNASVFKGLFVFENINAYHKTIFANVIFEKEARFQNAYFIDQFSFQDGQAKDIISFQGATFIKEFNGILAHYFNYADFSNVRFDGIFIANFSKFHDRLLVSNSTFQNRCDFRGVTIKEATFKKSYFLGQFNGLEAVVEKSWNVDDNYFFIKPMIDSKYISTTNKILLD